MPSQIDVVNDDCLDYLQDADISDVDLTFLDPPFNQDKEYPSHDDSMEHDAYWGWMKEVCSHLHDVTADGGSIYFMQREKNAEHVLRVLRETGWVFQNLIVWRKTTSAVPSEFRYGKKYQIIAFATKGEKPNTFNRLRHDPPLPENYDRERENGVYVTDVWTDIRELTSGYFAGDEPLRDDEGERIHKQQSPLELLTRIILTSTMPGDLVLDPFGGTGTTGVVADQLDRRAVLIEKDPDYYSVIQNRLDEERDADDVSELYEDYVHTEALEEIWGEERKSSGQEDITSFAKED
ncbi:MAG: site-specific DNA-methyltransferase [Halobacteria archaeon]|nr:site-specific DNA-methyltransferase [Halobacteria archaeon]